MFRSYTKMLLRNLWKNRSYDFLNISGLAIGIACAALLFLWAENEFSYDDFNTRKDYLYSVRVTINFDGRLFTMGSTPRVMGTAMQKEIPGIVNTARFSDTEQEALFGIGNKSVYAGGRFTDPSLFSMFSFTFIQGNPSKPFPDLYSIVLPEKTARKFFGEEQNLLGKKLRFNNEKDYVISGIIKDFPANSSLQSEWLAPYISKEDSWESYGPFTYVELDRNADPVIINEKLKHFLEQKNSTQKNEAFLFPMSKWRLFNEFRDGKATGGGRIEQVKMLLAIAWIILLIACINFMNLATARSQKRMTEVGVRKVLGANRTKLVLQFMGESIFLSLIAALTALAIIALSMGWFNQLMQTSLEISFTNPWHISGLILIALACGLISGIYPAFYLSSFKPISVFKGMRIKNGSATFVRKGLVVVQFSVSVLFIISTIIVYMQIQHVKNRKRGFEKENLIELDMQHDIGKIFPRIKQDLLQSGLIVNAAATDHPTVNGGNTDNRFQWDNKPTGSDISIAHRNITPGYFSTSGMKIIKGRDFDAGSGNESNNVIINESFAELLGAEKAVGKIIRSPRGNEPGILTNLTVVGVVDNYLFGNIYGKPGPVLFFCKQDLPVDYIYARIKPGHVANAVKTIEAIMKKDNPAFPLQFRFVDEQFENKFKAEVLTGKVSGIFAALAIFISCLGLLGLVAFTAERRTKEIGIRKVLGANVAGLVTLLSRDFLTLVVISCLVSFPLAWWALNNWLLNYEYRIEISWWIFPAAGILASLIALLTISFHAIKTAMLNPVKSLRME